MAITQDVVTPLVVNIIQRLCSHQVPFLARWLLAASLFDVITRPSPGVEQWVEHHAMTVNPTGRPCPASAPVVSMHVRAGDRCTSSDEGAPCFKLADYADALALLRSRYGSCKVSWCHGLIGGLFLCIFLLAGSAVDHSLHIVFCMLVLLSTRH